VPEAQITRLEDAGATVHAVPGEPGTLDLGAVLGVCFETGLTSILCEGGARLACSLVRDEHVTRMYVFVAPWAVGREGTPSFPIRLPPEAWEGWRPSLPPRVFDRDVLLTYDRPTEAPGEAGAVRESA